MPISEQLLWRAIRLLTDQYRHTPTAMAWASRMVGANRATAEAMLKDGFTPREVSLGTMEW